MITGILVLVTLVLQRLLGLPGLSAWATDLWLPLVWLVWPAMREDRAWPLWGLVFLGLGWDIVREPVIGPGGIAWSAAGFLVAWLARRVGDRSPVAWAGAGGLAALAVLLVRRAALVPLGLAGSWLWVPAVRTVFLGSLWCGLVGGIQSLDIVGAIRRVRRSRLR